MKKKFQIIKKYKKNGPNPEMDQNFKINKKK